jgi:hypothetical protein
LDWLEQRLDACGYFDLLSVGSTLRKAMGSAAARPSVARVVDLARVALTPLTVRAARQRLVGTGLAHELAWAAEYRKWSSADAR